MLIIFFQLRFQYIIFYLGEYDTKSIIFLEPRSTSLAEINVSNVKELSPKAKRLCIRATEFQRKAVYSTKSRQTLKRKLKFARNITASEMLDKTVSSMDRIRRRFFKCQLKNFDKKAKGRRYTLEDKVLALALYKQSATAYRGLSKIFSLPSRKTINKLLNRIPINPGLHNGIFSVLKEEVKYFKNPLDKYCILMFAEMSIQAHLKPNISLGSVDGFEDFGFKKSEKNSNHAQVKH